MTRMVYFAFDLLHHGGKDLTGLRLTERKAALERLLGSTSGLIRLSGRLHPDTMSTIIKIRSDKGHGKGMKSVETVEKLADFMTLQNKAGETRQISFGYASYSAIWQLKRE